MSYPDDLSRVEWSIREERSRQEAKWGTQNHDDAYWSLILAEEVGEAAHASLNGCAKSTREELVQVAAVAVAWIEAIDRRAAQGGEK